MIESKPSSPPFFAGFLHSHLHSLGLPGCLVGDGLLDWLLDREPGFSAHAPGFSSALFPLNTERLVKGASGPKTCLIFETCTVSRSNVWEKGNSGSTSFLLSLRPLCRILRTNSNKPENSYLFMEMELLWR